MKAPKWVASRDETTLLVGLGVQKAGTMWLDNYLRAHPDVHVPRCKEVNHFSTLYDPDREMQFKQRRFRVRRIERSLYFRARFWLKYLIAQFDREQRHQASPAFMRRLVAMHDPADPKHRKYWETLCVGYKGQRCITDISPDYAMLDEAHYAEIATAFPTAKFLLILRDPLDRSWSNLRMFYRSIIVPREGEIGFDPFLDRFVDGKYPFLWRRMDYARTLRNLTAAVPEDRRLVLFYETLFCDASIQALCDLLGIEFRPGNYGEVIHKGRTTEIRPDVRATLVDQLAPVYRYAATQFGDALPAEWRRSA